MRINFTAAAAALVLATASTARADGHVFRSNAGPVVESVSDWMRERSPAYGATEEAVDPVIPDQRALIIHRDGRETLLIETAFAGRGTDFAWVVPTPSVPKIEQASEELFPRLADATRPKLVSQVPDLALLGLGVTAALVFGRHGGRRGRRVGVALVATLALAAALGDGASTVGAPGVVLAGSPVSLPMTPQEAPVAVRQREVVGAFDAVTLSARDPDALVRWLADNGYAAPPGLAEVAAQYVRDGWVFNAMKLRRAADGEEAVRIRPLAFTFAAETPVYPMRLTGLATTPVAVQLFVAGDRRASSPGFATNLCSALTTSSDRTTGAGLVALDGGDARRLVGDAGFLTRLDRTFTPAEMTADSPIGWTEFEQVRPVALSRRAAHAMAWNLGALLAIGGLLGLASAAAAPVARARIGRPPSRIATAVVLAAAAAAGVAVWTLAPVVDTQPIDAAWR